MQVVKWLYIVKIKVFLCLLSFSFCFLLCAHNHFIVAIKLLYIHICWYFIEKSPPKKFKSKNLSKLIDEDPSITLKEMFDALGVVSSIISKRFKILVMVLKLGRWVRRFYELKQRLAPDIAPNDFDLFHFNNFDGYRILALPVFCTSKRSIDLIG